MAVENPSGFLRLFVAIPVPADVRQEIARAQGRLQRHTPPGATRWTRPEQFHLTLKFLGDVPVEQVGRLQEATAAICSTSAVLRLTAHGVGFFPDARRPRVIWAGASDTSGQLPELHRRLDAALRWLAPAEDKFTGHITLGRFKPGHHSAIPKLLELTADLPARHFGGWPAHEVELIRSELTSSGATHTAIATFKLVASGIPA